MPRLPASSRSTLSKPTPQRTTARQRVRADRASAPSLMSWKTSRASAAVPRREFVPQRPEVGVGLGDGGGQDHEVGVEIRLRSRLRLGRVAESVPGRSGELGESAEVLAEHLLEVVKVLSRRLLPLLGPDLF